MSALSRIVDAQGNRIPLPNSSARSVNLNASYDVLTKRGQTDTWATATPQNSAALDSPERRQQLRNLARYEVRNSAYCKGMVLRVLHEIIGTGPTLEIIPNVQTKESLAAANRFEKFWATYAEEIVFNARLELAFTEKIVGGESFLQMRYNPHITTVPVDFEVYEADQFSTPYFVHHDQYADTQYPTVDGIQFDNYGYPKSYKRLRSHPYGNYAHCAAFSNIEFVDAEYIIHFFRKERPSQYRGVSELAPVLSKFNLLRRYTDAVLGTAEKQSKIAGALRTTLGIDLCDDLGDGQHEIDVAGGTFVNLPRGWDINSFNSSQPVDRYQEFVSAILYEILQAFLMPRNIGLADSSQFNFASGRLDNQLFYRYVDRERERINIQMNRFFRFWLEFATLKNAIPKGLGAFTFCWHWPLREPLDAVKAARAATILKDANLLDVQRYWRGQVRNPADVIRSNLEIEKTERLIRQEMELSKPHQQVITASAINELKEMLNAKDD